MPIVVFVQTPFKANHSCSSQKRLEAVAHLAMVFYLTGSLSFIRHVGSEPGGLRSKALICLIGINGLVIKTKLTHRRRFHAVTDSIDPYCFVFNHFFFPSL